MPVDLLKWVDYAISNPPCPAVSNFIRGEVLSGTNLGLGETVGICTEGVMHSEIAYATRANVNDDFGAWNRHAFSADFVYDGGFVTADNGVGAFDLVYSASTASNRNDIFWLRGSDLTPPSASPDPISATINTSAQEDNPHLERIDADNLILLFDNHGVGDPDTQISFSHSADNGSTWTSPQPMAINSAAATEDLQGHLYQDASDNWWLYFSSNRGGIVEIYRSQHGSNDLVTDFENWSEPPDKVVSVGSVSGGLGTIAAVGEPTLSANGDLYFVVVYCKNPEDQTAYDSCDIDPWVATRK